MCHPHAARQDHKQRSHDSFTFAGSSEGHCETKDRQRATTRKKTVPRVVHPHGATQEPQKKRTMKSNCAHSCSEFRGTRCAHVCWELRGTLGGKGRVCEPPLGKLGTPRCAFTWRDTRTQKRESEIEVRRRFANRLQSGTGRQKTGCGAPL